MDDMTPRERFFKAMHREPVDRPPVCGMTTTATVELMDHVGAAWPDAHTDARKMAKIALGVYDYLGLESVRVPYCLTYEAEALGCTIDLGKKNSTPMVKNSPFKGELDPNFELMGPEEMMKLARNKAVADAAEIIIKERTVDLPTLLGVTGPFTIAGHLAGTESLILWTLTDPDVVSKYTEFTGDYVKMWLEFVETLGIDSIQMSEPTASYDMISEDMFDIYVLPNLQRVYKPLKETMKVLHICGDTVPILSHMAASGADALSIEEKANPYDAVKAVGDKVALVGNVGVVRDLLQGTPETVIKSAQTSIDAGFNIISAGCGMSALIKKENIWAMVNATKNYRA
jgi:methyltransferase, mtaA/cmuA family